MKKSKIGSHLPDNRQQPGTNPGDGRIMAVSVSAERGGPKSNVSAAALIKDWGIEGDSHAGSDRQVPNGVAGVHLI